jgi:hypothetical protein
LLLLFHPDILPSLEVSCLWGEVQAARALAELMRHLNALGQRIAAELPGHDRNGQAPYQEPS